MNQQLSRTISNIPQTGSSGSPYPVGQPLCKQCGAPIPPVAQSAGCLICLVCGYTSGG